MAIPVIASQQPNSSDGSEVTTLTLVKPSGVVSGDGLLLLIGGDNADVEAPDWNTVSGWARESTAGIGNNDAHYAIYSRISDGTEGVDVDVTCVTACECYGWYLRMTGIDPDDFVHVIGTPRTAAGNPSTMTMDEATTTVDDCLAMFIFSFDGADGPTFGISGTGWTIEDEDVSGTEINEASGCFGTKDMPSFGVTGDVTITPAVSDGSSGVIFAIAPAVAGFATIRRRLEDY